jgi:hypothetical protein
MLPPLVDIDRTHARILPQTVECRTAIDIAAGAG